MSEQTGKVDDSQSPPKIKKKFRKGDLVKVDREKYSFFLSYSNHCLSIMKIVVYIAHCEAL